MHAGDGEDPTEYTRTKRNAEELVATSGVPYLILRPSIVIGDSRDGRYFGTVARDGILGKVVGVLVRDGHFTWRPL